MDNNKTFRVESITKEPFTEKNSAEFVFVICDTVGKTLFHNLEERCVFYKTRLRFS